MYEPDCQNVLCSLTLIDSNVAVKKGYMKLLVRTVDTGVDVVAIATLNNIKPDGKRLVMVWIYDCNPCKIGGTLPLPASYKVRKCLHLQA